MSRPWILLVVGALALTACSDGGDEAASVASSAPPTTATAPDAPSPKSEAAGGEDAALASDSDVVPQWSIAIDLTADGFEAGPIDASIAWTGDPNDVIEDGPFGSFAACSGLRDEVSAYSVFVSGADGVDAVDIWTATPVMGAGLYDAEVRIERAGSAPLTASGTMTIHDGLQQGEFTAFGVDGGRIEGSFSCSGAEPPAPLTNGEADGAVEVFAVLRDGEAERFVGLATDATDVAVCEPDGDVVLRVAGDAAIGSITAIELPAGPAASAGLRVAGTDYEFADVTVVLDDPSGASTVSGAFTAANPDGISVDGAFRCT